MVVLATAAFTAAALAALAASPPAPARPRTAATQRTPAAVLPRPRLAYPTALPPGAGKPIAERSCLMCHSAMLVTQQAKDSTGWEKTLTQMEKWGVMLAPSEHDTLSRYLRGAFPPSRRR